MSTWYIHKPFLMGGPNPPEHLLKQIRASERNLLISLLDETHQPPNCPPERALALGFTRYNIPIADFTGPRISQFLEFLGLVRGFPDVGRVYVHCQAGMGRTGTMAVAYWIARGLDPDSALALVRQNQPLAVETEEQMQRLREFYDRFRRVFQAP